MPFGGTANRWGPHRLHTGPAQLPSVMQRCWQEPPSDALLDIPWLRHDSSHPHWQQLHVHGCVLCFIMLAGPPSASTHVIPWPNVARVHYAQPSRLQLIFR